MRGSTIGRVLGVLGAAWGVAGGAAAEVVVAQLLARKPADPEATDRLMQAVRAGDAAEVERLLKAGASARERSGGTGLNAVTLAVTYGDEAVVRAMIAGGVNFKTISDEQPRLTLMENALLRKSSEGLIRALMDAGLKLTSDRISVIGSPAAIHDPGVMRLALKSGEDVNRVYKGWTALEVAVVQGRPECVRLLLDAGASVRLGGGGERNAFSVIYFRSPAAGAGEIVAMLKAAGADLNAHDPRGSTPLSLATYCGNEEVVRALLSNGADVNMADAGGQTPLIYAALGGGSGLMKVLLEAGADPNLTDKQGATAMYWSLWAADPIPQLRRGNGEEDEGLDFTRLNETLRACGASELEQKLSLLLKAGGNPSRAYKDYPLLVLAAGMWDSNRLTRSMNDAFSGLADNRSRWGTLSAIRDFYDRRDPTVIVRMLVEAGAERTCPGHADALDIAAARLDAHRTKVLELVRTARRTTEPKAPGGVE